VPGRKQHLARRAALAATLVSLAVPAAAPASTKSASTTIPAADQAFATVTAKCPRGQRATGGGFRTDPFVRFTRFVTVYESRKVGQRSWRVSGLEIAPGMAAPMNLTSYVYCSADGPSTKAVSHTATTPATSALTSSDARCSSGKAQAGGFLLPAKAVEITDNFRSSSKVWRARTLTSTPGVAVISYVYCAQGSVHTRAADASSAANAAPVIARSDKCKGGEHVLAGGFNQGNADAATMNLFVLPYESLRDGKRWRVASFHQGTTSTTLTSRAYCG
jgi:hypothetical protein